MSNSLTSLPKGDDLAKSYLSLISAYLLTDMSPEHLKSLISTTYPKLSKKQKAWISSSLDNVYFSLRAMALDNDYYLSLF